VHNAVVNLWQYQFLMGHLPLTLQSNTSLGPLEPPPAEDAGAELHSSLSATRRGFWLQGAKMFQEWKQGREHDVMFSYWLLYEWN